MATLTSFANAAGSVPAGSTSAINVTWAISGNLSSIYILYQNTDSVAADIYRYDVSSGAATSATITDNLTADANHRLQIFGRDGSGDLIIGSGTLNSIVPLAVPASPAAPTDLASLDNKASLVVFVPTDSGATGYGTSSVNKLTLFVSGNFFPSDDQGNFATNDLSMRAKDFTVGSGQTLDPTGGTDVVSGITGKKFTLTIGPTGSSLVAPLRNEGELISGETVATGIYEFSTVLHNTQGVSSQGTGVAFTINDTPSAVTNVVVTDTDDTAGTQLSVSWTAPVAVEGQDAVFTYYIYQGAAGSAFGAATLFGTATGTSTTITGLTNGNTYRVWVTAAYGLSPGIGAEGTETQAASDVLVTGPVSGGTLTLLSGPGNSPATASGEVNVAFPGFSLNGGTQLTSGGTGDIVVEYWFSGAYGTGSSGYGNAVAAGFITTDTNFKSGANVTGLNDGTEYAFRVHVRTSTYGASSSFEDVNAVYGAATPVGAATAQDAPVISVTGDGTLTVTWSLATQSGGTITGQELQEQITDASDSSVQVFANSTTTSTTTSATSKVVPTLVNGHNHYYRMVTTFSHAGTGSTSTSTSASSLAGIPYGEPLYSGDLYRSTHDGAANVAVTAATNADNLLTTYILLNGRTLDELLFVDTNGTITHGSGSVIQNIAAGAFVDGESTSPALTNTAAVVDTIQPVGLATTGTTNTLVIGTNSAGLSFKQITV